LTTTAVATPAQAMESCCGPAAAPRVHVNVACPCAFVVAEPAASEPPPCVTLALAPAPGTGLPPASVRTTTIGASVVLAGADWVFPLTRPQVAGFPMLTVKAPLVAAPAPDALATSV